jgi:hypothetical protein
MLFIFNKINSSTSNSNILNSVTLLFLNKRRIINTYEIYLFIFHVWKKIKIHSKINVNISLLLFTFF